ncbi:hypothetical protein O23A_p3890 [Aeromonas salmonicida]|nr:hypothetical protein O23A_p3890 [Aeromonas salmonicida]
MGALAPIFYWLKLAEKKTKKEGQKNWPYNWKQCEQCRAFTRSPSRWNE